MSDQKRLIQEMDRLRRLARNCLQLAGEVTDPAAAERLRKLANGYRREMHKLFEGSGKRKS